MDVKRVYKIYVDFKRVCETFVMDFNRTMRIDILVTNSLLSTFVFKFSSFEIVIIIIVEMSRGDCRKIVVVKVGGGHINGRGGDCSGAMVLGLDGRDDGGRGGSHGDDGGKGGIYGWGWLP